MSNLQVFTSNWSAVYHEAKQYPVLRDLPFIPVRISVGVPRFWSKAREFPYMKELAPVGIRDQADFTKLYRTRLEEAGVEEIRGMFNDLLDSYCKPLMLLCYEKISTDDPFSFEEACHRRTFAKWWHEKTDWIIPEAQSLDLDSLQALIRVKP